MSDRITSQQHAENAAEWVRSQCAAGLDRGECPNVFPIRTSRTGPWEIQINVCQYDGVSDWLASRGDQFQIDFEGTTFTVVRVPYDAHYHGF